MRKNPSSKTFRESFKISSPLMKEVHDEVYDYAFHARPCIFLGPSGAGKEFVARYYYQVFTEDVNKEAPFFSLNCAGLTPTLAISELFGHTKGSFTDASEEKKGLFEMAEGGILFLDEIGDLPPEVQPMLLRAIDPETSEARKLGSNVNYSTGKVIVVCATDQPKNSMRQALISRLGKQVQVPGVDQRLDDIPAAVQFFAKASLLKRRDIEDLIPAVFGKPANKKIKSPSGSNPVDYLALRIGVRLSPRIMKRSWPGNFRDIRNAVDTAVIRAKKAEGIENFIKSVEYYYNYHQRNFSYGAILDRSARVLNNNKTEGQSEEKNVDNKILNTINSIFPRTSHTEKIKWAAFLSEKQNQVFYRKELDNLFTSFKKRTIQNRLKKLVESGIIVRKGERGDEYYINLEVIVSPEKIPQSADSLSLPELNFISEGRKKEITHVLDLIHKSRGVFISGEKQTGKTTFVFSLGAVLMKTRPVYYHALGTAKLTELFHIIIEKLKKNNIDNIPEFKQISSDEFLVLAATLTGFIDKLFSADSSPVLILDNVGSLKSSNELQTLNTMLQNWKIFTFILVGEKMGNELELGDGVGLAEYRIGGCS